MNAYGRLLLGLGEVPRSPLGPRPKCLEELESRRNEAARLTSLLEAGPRFSFVRLGDMDLALLLAAQEGETFLEYLPESAGWTGTQPAGGPGISVRGASRLRLTFEQADYVDFHERLWPVGALLPRLRLKSKLDQARNPDSATSYILLTWMETEFKRYCERHRVGFAGAEAAVLACLVGQPEYQAAASIWPGTGEQFFHQPREDGARLEENLDLIKQDLKGFVRDHQIDTLFLSLGGGAKILACELAEELGIRCMDFGAMLRALCYLGSDGNRASRSTHAPFYHRLDFDLVMDAVEKAYPRLTPEQLFAKANAQVILELQVKERGWTHASFEMDLSPKNIAQFQQAERKCAARYAKLARKNAATRAERRRFLHFCGTHSLTWSGKSFLFWFQAKSLVALWVEVLRRRLKRKGESNRRSRTKGLKDYRTGAGRMADARERKSEVKS